MLFKHQSQLQLAAACCHIGHGTRTATTAGLIKAPRIWFSPTAAATSASSSSKSDERISFVQQVVNDIGQLAHDAGCHGAAAPLALCGADENVDSLPPAHTANDTRGPLKPPTSAGQREGRAAVTSPPRSGERAAAPDLAALLRGLQQHIDVRFDRLEARMAACEARLGALGLERAQPPP